METQVEALISVLWRFKRVIGWTIVDIVGFSPDIHTHKLQLKLDCTSSIVYQHRLNPLIKEVVKKEIIKFLMSELFILLQTASGLTHFNAFLRRVGSQWALMRRMILCQ